MAATVGNASGGETVTLIVPVGRCVVSVMSVDVGRIGRVALVFGLSASDGLVSFLLWASVGGTTEGEAESLAVLPSSSPELNWIG